MLKAYDLNIIIEYIKKVESLIKSVGAKVKFLPTYSCDLSPIELCWSKLKEIIRSAKAGTKDALDVGVGVAAR